MMIGYLNERMDRFSLREKISPRYVSRQSQDWRRKIQMIFQQPATSLDPRFTVAETLSEPLTIHQLYRDEPREKKSYFASDECGFTCRDVG